MVSVDAEAGNPLLASPSSTALALTPLPTGFFLWLLITNLLYFPQLGGLRCSDQNLVTFTLPQAGFNHGSVDRDIVLFAVNLVWPDNPERQLVIVFVYQCYPGAEECLARLNGAVFHHPKLG